MAHLAGSSRMLLKPLAASIPASRTAVTYKQCLLNIPPTQVSTVQSTGIRVATESRKDSTVATVGVCLHGGTRYQMHKGVAYFLEHMLFKGTNKRSKAQLEADIGSIPAYFNVKTGKELTYVYANCLSKDIPKVVEILADVLQNPILDDEAEIERQREVVLNELENAQTDYKFITMDYLHSVAFSETPLSHSIFGSTEEIKDIKKEDLKDYAHRFFRPGHMVLAGVGDIGHQMLTDLAEKHFKEPPKLELEVNKGQESRFLGADVRERDDDHETAHVAMGVEGPSFAHQDSIPMMIAQAYLGSWDKSVLNAHISGMMCRAVVEQNAARSFENFMFQYRDSGLFGTFFIGEREKLAEMTNIVQTHWQKLCGSMTDFRLEGAKFRLKSAMLSELETTNGAFHDIGRHIQYSDYRAPFVEVNAKIEGVSADVFHETCYRRIFDKTVACASIGANEGLPDINIISRQMTPPVFY